MKASRGKNVCKAVLPAAGLGESFLPATKAQQRVMLPVVDKPMIQYAIEEARESGIQDIVIVMGRGKAAIQEHFETNIELEHVLEQRKKLDLLEIVRRLSQFDRLAYVSQHVKNLGSGQAILRSRFLLEDHPFSVVLSDDVVVAPQPCLKQLLDVFDTLEEPASVLAVTEITPEWTPRRGIAICEPTRDAEAGPIYQVREVTNKIQTEAKRSNFAIVGRYVLTSDIFPALARQDREGRALHVADGIKNLLADGRKVYAVKFRGTHYYASEKLGFLKATVELALRHPDLSEQFRSYLLQLRNSSGIFTEASIPVPPKK
jgi:UTP--glucose-1-phosphate uridylyltransferase